MSDEPLRLADVATAPRERTRIENHVCDHTGCGRGASFGFARPRHPAHWPSLAHRAEGDRYLLGAMMSDYVLPSQKKPKLIVVIAFDRAIKVTCSPPMARQISKVRNEQFAPPRRWPLDISASSRGVAMPARRLATTARRQRCLSAAMYPTWNSPVSIVVCAFRVHRLHRERSGR